MQELVQLIGSSGKHSQATLEIFPISLPRRLLKSLAFSLGLVALAALSVIVPLLHFILPIFFLACAIYAAISTFSRKQTIKSGQGSCPECGADFRILERIYKLPFRDTCEECRREINIRN